jgi:hypothetical protein
LVGYVVSALAWRLWLRSKWRSRRHARAAGAMPVKP